MKKFCGGRLMSPFSYWAGLPVVAAPRGGGGNGLQPEESLNKGLQSSLMLIRQRAQRTVLFPLLSLVWFIISHSISHRNKSQKTHVTHTLTLTSVCVRVRVCVSVCVCVCVCVCSSESTLKIIERSFLQTIYCIYPRYKGLITLWLCWTVEQLS